MSFPKPLIPAMTLALATAAGLAPAGWSAPAQQQQAPSVAEAARRAREQKAAAPATGKIFTNDNLSEIKGNISVVGSAPPPAPAPAEGAAAQPAGEAAAAAAEGAAPAAEPAAAPAPEQRGEAYWRQRFAEARRQLALNERELDVLQREYNLKQQQFYTDPNVALREQYGREDLNRTLEQINAKRAEVERGRQAIAALEDELRRAGGDPGWAREPAGQQPAGQTQP